MYKAYCDVCGREINATQEKIHKLEIKNVNELDRVNNYYIDMICEDCKNQLVSIVDNEKTSRGNIIESN